MKIIHFVTLLISAMIVGSAATVSADVAPQPCLDAIRAVESSGGHNHHDGDSGKAIGNFQIHHNYWHDAVEFDPSIGGTYQDCRDDAYALQIVIAYWQRYCPEALATGDFEVMARTHNGGPRGADNDATIAYWHRVRKHLHQH